MLKGIPSSITPELLKTLSEMGHGDTILLADGNFPAYSKGIKVIRADNIDVATLLKDIMTLFPLDPFTDKRALVMREDSGEMPKCAYKYESIINESGDDAKVISLPRQEFYDASKTCFAIVLTSDLTPYANLILRKGIIG